MAVGLFAGVLPDGRQQKKSFAGRTDAERLLVALNAEQHRAGYIDPTAGKVTVVVQVG